MKQKFWQRLFSIVLLAGMLLGMVQPRSAMAAAPAEPPTLAEIDPALLIELEQEGTAAFFVQMSAKADLSAADKITDWSERGWFVYNALLETARTSQAKVIEYAEKNGIEYRSFYTNNSVYFPNGTGQMVQDLAAFDGVQQLKLEGYAYITPEAPLATTYGPEYSAPASPDAYGYNLTTLAPAASGGLYGMQAVQVWQDYGVKGSGIVVANIDTGANYLHEALIRQYRGTISPGTYDHNYNWYMPTSGCGDGTYACDNNGHGSGTMGIMVGETADLVEQIGIAPEATWIACKGCETTGCSDAALTGCADWMVAPCPIGVAPGGPGCNADMRPHIVNNSWGGGGGDTWYQDYVDAWVAAGIFPAFSAGNTVGCQTLGSPGDNPPSFGTAAHSSAGENTYAGGPSSFYLTPSCDPDLHQIDPHISSPTFGRTSNMTPGTYYNLSGTSGASPHTAGAVALIWSANPGYIGDIPGTFTVLEQTANHDYFSETGCGKPACAGTNIWPNYDYGWGFLDALAAVEYVGVGGQGALEGNVTEALKAPGDPLVGVTITAYPQGPGGNQSTTTDASGYYTLTLMAGLYDVEATSPYFTSVLVEDIEIITNTVETQNFAMDPKGLLYGYVTDADNGFGLDATVTADSGEFANTDPSDGYYELYLDAGTYDVTAAATDYASDTETVVIVSGVNLQQDFDLLAAVSFVPSPLGITLTLGGDGSVPVVLTNNQGAPYDFAFMEIGGDFIPNKAAGIDATWPGPDGFGYEGSAVDYDWIELSATGTMIPQLTDDGVSAALPIGFTFNFYGTDYTQFYVGANGFLRFDTSTSSLTNQCPLPNATAPNNLIALMWDDLDPGDNSDPVYYQYFPSCPVGGGACTVVQYEDFCHYPGGATCATAGTFEAILFDNGSVQLQYEDAGAELGSGSTTGIENANVPGNYGLTFACDAGNSLVDGTSICFAYPGSSGCAAGDVLWFDIAPASGTVPATGSINATAYFTATAAVGVDQPGEYHMTLRVDGEPQLDVPVVMTVEPSATMGQIEGIVTSERPGGFLEAEILIENSGGITWTTTSDPDTGYYTYWLEAGTYNVTASAPGYLDDAVTGLVITADATTTQDFELVLDAPWIVVDPAFLDVTVTFGGDFTDTLTVYNDGTLPLDFEISEHDEAFSPTAGEDVLVVSNDSTADTAMETALTANGYTWLEVTPTVFNTMPVVDLLEYQAVFWAGSCSTTYDAHVMAYLDAGGSFYISDNDQGYFYNASALYTTYLQATFVSDDPGIDTLIGEDFMTGLNPNIAADPYPDHFTVKAEGTRIFQFTGGNAAGVAVDRNGYKAIYTSWDFQQIASAADEVELVSRVMGFLGAQDIVWLSEAPITGTIPAGSWTEVDVTFDSGMVSEPGVYQANLRFDNNDPLNGRLSIPVTMTVQPTTDLGLLDGTVTSDRPGAPLEASLLIEDGLGGSWTVDADPSGFYYRWLYEGTYTVTASAPGYLDDSAVVVIVGTQTTVQDFVLLLEQPEVVVSPPPAEQVLVFGDVITETLVITNTGYADLEFTLREQDGGALPLISIPAFTGPAPQDNRPVSFGPAPDAPQVNGTLGIIINGAPAYGINLGTDTLYNWPDIGVPGTWNLVGATGVASGYTGDFMSDDFTKMYVVDSADKSLYTVSTATGAKTLVGATGIAAGLTTTGMGWDESTGTMYIVATDGSSANLYTLNLTSGAATLVTALPSDAALTIAIAFSPDGVLFAHDINQDRIITINKTTGAVTSIGLTGLAANYAQGMDFDDETGVLYLAAYTTTGALYIADTTTGATTLVGAFPGGAEVDSFAIQTAVAADISWLSEVPAAGTIPAGETFTVDLVYDSGQVLEPGTYIGNLHVNSNDPYVARVTLPVTLTVLPSGSIGLLDGMVQSLGHCDANPVPAEATIIAENPLGATWTIMSSGTTGLYSRWLPADTYHLTVSAPDHMGAEADVVVTENMTTTHDFDLRWLGACVSVDPVAYEVTVAQGYDWTESLDISNMGAGATDFELTEVDGGFTPALNAIAYLPATTPSNSPAARGGTALAQPARTVIFPAGLPSAGEIAVLIISPDNTVAGLVATLAAYPDLLVTVWPTSSANPGLADMQPYDVVIVGNDLLWTAVGWDKVSIGNALADYIDGGGKVIEAMYVQSFDDWGFGGRYLTGGYSPFTVASTDVWGAGSMTISNPSHPVMAGVTTIADTWGHQNPGLRAGAESLAAWTDSYHGVAVNENVVALNLLLTEAPGWTGDVGTLLHNACVWLAGGGPQEIPWVYETPVTGTVDADSLYTVDVTFVATATQPLGTYTGTLILATADIMGDIEIPLILHVVTSIPPEVSFTADELLCAGVETTFVNTSFAGQPAATEFLWDFGDGVTMTAGLEDVTHTYMDAGLYDVTLEACNVGGCDTFTLQVEVVAQPIADFTYVANGATVDFTNTSTDADTYLWDFGDGETSTDMNPSHTYAAAGDYVVTLYAYNDCGMGTKVVTITIGPEYYRIWLPTLMKN